MLWKFNVYIGKTHYFPFQKQYIELFYVKVIVDRKTGFNLKIKLKLSKIITVTDMIQYN